MTGHGATGQQDIVLAKEFFMVLRFSGGADEIRERLSLHANDF